MYRRQMFVIICAIIVIISSTTHQNELVDLNLDLFSDYEFRMFGDEKRDLRRRFLSRKKEFRNDNYRVKLIENLTDGIYIDDIMHTEYVKRQPLYEESKKYESVFRNLLSMKGVKYIFKRDFFWRTWRYLKNDKNASVIYYKSVGNFNVSCPKCQYSAYWIIEENPPPCPYEIISIQNPRNICTIHYNEIYKPLQSCRFITIERILETCNNPVETKWRIIRDYSVVPDLDLDIKPDLIMFKMINSSNHIFFSRIMKPANKNYVCVNDCGLWDPNTKKVLKKESKVVLNLMNHRQKNKREYKLNTPTMYQEGFEPNGLHYKMLVKPAGNLATAKSISSCKKIKDLYAEKEYQYFDY
ncbi:unnamed protein product [Leptidea sinapis]|uniref:Uncharacterized protein n=1 Tax=Leptidea sinapis TaxID=189913 RepID=A0A5E4Q1W1_9NEOP|nr:unnamed protein product [Leptidea sinapis]